MLKKKKLKNKNNITAFTFKIFDNERFVKDVYLYGLSIGDDSDDIYGSVNSKYGLNSLIFGIENISISINIDTNIMNDYLEYKDINNFKFHFKVARNNDIVAYNHKFKNKTNNPFEKNKSNFFKNNYNENEYVSCTFKNEFLKKNVKIPSNFEVKGINNEDIIKNDFFRAFCVLHLNFGWGRSLLKFIIETFKLVLKNQNILNNTNLNILKKLVSDYKVNSNENENEV